MPDLVVTVPRDLWTDWIEEGDAVGEPESGEEWGFFVTGWTRPPIRVGERLYVVAHDRLRGYAPVTRVAFYPYDCDEHLAPAGFCSACQLYARREGWPSPPRLDSGRLARGQWAIGRRGGAVAVAIPPTFSDPQDFEQTEMAKIRGFRGFRQRWWPRETEFPFPDWATRDLWLNKSKGRRAAQVADTKRRKEGGQQSLF